jgi:Rrf2 family transcriptional regulator, iron-sulfur cluster assembly transcription factor
MILSQTAEYALRAMAYLAILPEGTAVRARDVSDFAGIPTPYASKVLRRMVEKGLLCAQKGHGGGFRLSRPPEAIRFLDVLEAADDSLETQRCAFGWEKCSGARPCLLHEPFRALKESLLRWARDTTLASVRAGMETPRSALQRSAR